MCFQTLKTHVVGSSAIVTSVGLDHSLGSYDTEVADALANIASDPRATNHAFKAVNTHQVLSLFPSVGLVFYELNVIYL